jgi:hypothetical protein
MMGLFVLVVLPVLWLSLVVGGVILVTLVLPRRWWRTVLRIALVLVLIPLPILDDKLAGPQFEELCRQNAQLQIIPKAVGRTVYLKGVDDVEVKDKWVPMRIRTWRFVDDESGEVLVTFNQIHASGGWFTRGLSEGRVPQTFHGSCQPKDAPVSKQQFAALGITYIEPPRR